jgi:hypothetical protein
MGAGYETMAMVPRPLAGLLGGCAANHHLIFVNRTTGEMGSSEVSSLGRSGGDIQIALSGKTYSGSWVYVANGGAAGLAVGSASSGLATATATGTMVAMPTGGGGTILASAPDGATLRCQFQYNQIGNTGIGSCQDNKDGQYDLQIR